MCAAAPSAAHRTSARGAPRIPGRLGVTPCRALCPQLPGPWPLRTPASPPPHRGPHLALHAPHLLSSPFRLPWLLAENPHPLRLGMELSRLTLRLHPRSHGLLPPPPPPLPPPSPPLLLLLRILWPARPAPPARGWYAPVRLSRLRWMLLEPTRRKEETQAGCGDPSGRPCLRDPFSERPAK